MINETHYPCKFWFCNCRFNSQQDLDSHYKAMGKDGYTHKVCMMHFWRKNGSPKGFIVTKIQKINKQRKLDVFE